MAKFFKRENNRFGLLDMGFAYSLSLPLNVISGTEFGIGFHITIILFLSRYNTCCTYQNENELQPYGWCHSISKVELFNLTFGSL